MSYFILSENIQDVNKKTSCLMINFKPELSIYKSVTECFLTSFDLGLFIKVDSELYNNILSDVLEYNYFILQIDNKDVKFNFKNIEYIPKNEGV